MDNDQQRDFLEERTVMADLEREGLEELAAAEVGERERLRAIRRAIADLPAKTNAAYKVKAHAITIVLNAESAAAMPALLREVPDAPLTPITFRADGQGLHVVHPSDVSIELRHTCTCRCHYTLDRATTDDVKLIDIRCIHGYHVANRGTR